MFTIVAFIGLLIFASLCVFSSLLTFTAIFVDIKINGRVVDSLWEKIGIITIFAVVAICTGSLTYACAVSL